MEITSSPTMGGQRFSWTMSEQDTLRTSDHAVRVGGHIDATGYLDGDATKPLNFWAWSVRPGELVGHGLPLAGGDR